MHPCKLPARLLLAVLLLLPAAAPAADRAQDSPAVAFEFTSVIPLGGDVLQLEPIHRRLFLLGSAGSPAFAGMKRIEKGDVHWVLGPDGKRLRRFPKFVLFRVTADARQDTMLDDEQPYPQPIDTDLNRYLLDLHFRVVVFDGLEQRELQPRSVQMIGVPASQPSDERIYLVGVNLPDLPANDRVVLEVRDDRDNRLTKFHLDF